MSANAPNIDFPALIEPVARHLLGEPNRHLSSRTELRFGTNGSISVEIAGDRCGQWYDHESKCGGGIAGSVRVLHLPDLPPKGDVSD
ncbi:MAG: hypothetical protein ACREF3_18960 [Acetobacteraceae bacterium]